MPLYMLIYSKISFRSSMDLANKWTNPLVDCEQSIKNIDIGAWREPGSLIFIITIKENKYKSTL